MSAPSLPHVTSPAPAAQWHELAQQALVTQTPSWAACVQGSGWRDRSRLYELGRDRRLLVPLVGRGYGPSAVLASWPHGWGYGGVLASDGAVTTDDVALVARDLAGLGALRTSVVPSPFDPAWAAAAPGAQATVGHLTHVLDLRGGPDAVWRGYSSNVRRSVRRAERSGVEVQRDDTGALLPVFAELHRKSVERWARSASRPLRVARLAGRLDEPPRRLRALARAHGHRLTLWAGFVDGAPAAVVVVLRGGSHTLYWRGAMDRDLATRSQVNALLHHRAIEEAMADASEHYSFGESDEGSALADYKAKFGARPVRWSSYHFERAPVTSAIGAVRAAYARAGRLSLSPGQVWR